MSNLVVRAAVSDKPAIIDLLTKSNLPIDGVDEFMHGFSVVRNADGVILGCAAIERHKDHGLLRSVAVDSPFRGTGLGQCLISEVIDQAEKEGVKRLVLLTTTAREFFEKHFDFHETARLAFDDVFRDSPEWNLPRCSSAVVMTKELIP